MIALVCGGRDYADAYGMFVFLEAFHAKTPIAVLVNGAAPGADRLAGVWAARSGIHYAAVPALWDHYRKLGRLGAAGPCRNAAMLLLRPEVVIAFPGGDGTADMVAKAKKAGIRVVEVSNG